MTRDFFLCKFHINVSNICKFMFFCILFRFYSNVGKHLEFNVVESCSCVLLLHGDNIFLVEFKNLAGFLVLQLEKR